MMEMWVLLIVTTNFGLILCIPDMTTNGEPTFGRYYDGPNTRDEDVRAYFEECPEFEARLYPFCERVTCRNQCGGFNYPTYAVSCIRLPPCSCDVLCTAFDDCCWDYETECPEERARYEKEFSDFKNLSVSCETGVAIINGHRSSASEPQRDEKTNKDVVVSDLQTGLTFRSLEVYHSFFNGSLGKHGHLKVNEAGHKDDFLLFWNKRIESGRHLSVEELRHIMDGDFTPNGDASVHMIDICPVKEGIRVCILGGKVHANCSKRHDKEECRSADSIQMKSLSALCDLQFAPDKYVASYARKSPANVTNNATNTCLQDDVKLCAFEFDEKRHPKSVPQSSLSVLFSFDENKGGLKVVNVIPPTSSGSWKTLRCVVTAQEKCELTPICRAGYINMNTVCRKPNKVFILVQGQASNYELFSILQGLIIAIEEPFSSEQLMFDTDWTYETTSNYENTSINATITLKLYLIDFESEAFIASEHISTYLQSKLLDDDDVTNVEVCFASVDNVNNFSGATAPKYCERYSYRHNFVPKHFESKSSVVPTKADYRSASGRHQRLSKIILLGLAMSFV